MNKINTDVNYRAMASNARIVMLVNQAIALLVISMKQLRL